MKMLNKAVWVEYRSLRKKPHWIIITRICEPNDPKRLIGYKAAHPTVMKIDKEFFKVTYCRDWWAYERERK